MDAATALAAGAASAAGALDAASWNGQSREAHRPMSLETRKPELKRKANPENSDKSD